MCGCSVINNPGNSVCRLSLGIAQHASCKRHAVYLPNTLWQSLYGLLQAK